MGKTLILLLAALLLISAITAATATTTIRRMSSRCERQVRREKLEHCQQYLRSEIRMIMFPNEGNQACCLKECCDMLQELDSQCVCEALQSAAEEVRERMVVGKGGEEREMGRMMMRRAMQIPQRCGIRVPKCDINAATGVEY